MAKREIYLGDANLNDNFEKVDGEFVVCDSEKYYKISHYDVMDDFFMSIVSDSDHWMFLSSNGSLTAGRKDRDNALFPYYTDDKIHDYQRMTGSYTSLLVEKDNKTYLWEPFSKETSQVYKIVRNLYKSIYGNKIIFEEENLDLGVSFQYSWANSEKFGFIRKSSIQNTGNNNLKVEVLDGIRNILPYGLDYAFQNEFSNLLNAYKKNELLAKSKLAVFSLSSIPVDRAEPSESLKATTVWSWGLENSTILLSDNQINNFKSGQSLATEEDVRAARGAYLINNVFELKADESQKWGLVAEINQDNGAVAELNDFIQTENDIDGVIAIDIEKGTRNLIEIVADADGLQQGSDDLSCARHFSNTLFNVMRGGIFNDGYQIDVVDFKLFVNKVNKKLEAAFSSWLKELPAKLTYDELIDKAKTTADTDLIRICYEYLPLTFSRRHGDPSRPWNKFSIETKNEDGSPKLSYEGNWRDIFQNWEALGLSFPEFVEGMIAKFLNASTPDGYNPYRITREGIDWECPDPNDPWAYIGYWGDHQIIYLQKLLELSDKYHPGQLGTLLTKDIFVYANVPYRIKSYKDIVANPQDTIQFDAELNASIKEKVAELGADARMLANSKGDLYKVNLTEKVLVTLLAKLSNFIPEAGIWLNTQRPEWNDANNALVGNGVSMVTLYYMRRFIKFWSDHLESLSNIEITLSGEVKQLLDTIHNLFANNTALLEKGFSKADRKLFADTLGIAGETYRNSIYEKSFKGERISISTNELKQFMDVALAYMDQSIRANKREDGLYHAYNLIAFDSEGIAIRYLYEMLEGQVAVLSAGYLDAKESLSVMDALKSSALFRENQYSYILYPDRQLPLFVEKNNIPKNKVEGSSLLSKLVADNNTTVLSRDKLGNYHFNGVMRNADELVKALDALPKEKYGKLVDENKEGVLAIYESMFDHQSFTGRSGTFYGYEGLGSIYWHMVSKLLLAVQENYFEAERNNADPAVIGRLKDHYYEVKAGIGLYKSPDLYGAFPTDAYSHTPGGAGVKQPGMTGQVKEDVITRMNELGVDVINGEIVFNTSLLNPKELLEGDAEFTYFDVDDKEQRLNLKAGQLAYTVCKVPVIYSKANKNEVVVTMADGKKKTSAGVVIDTETSAQIFKRNGVVKSIELKIE
ncbi:hypothetical protein [Marinilabilia rubra]|uniref:Cellobiose phosphorylase n=1 Tax=Marinilabilia rubra TaxID=2162893 RepID=A0A2U2BAQ4_9BACT|nr:hypothetical protein [Marinilabilia rubra]PWE00146.1 hypothetical protein DDZ16_07275 [Marinilabilia rubra]